MNNHNPGYPLKFYNCLAVATRAAGYIAYLSFLTASLCEAQDAPGITASNKGIQIDAGGAGKFLLPVPGLLMGEKDYSGEKPVVELDGTDNIVARYPSGAVLRMKVSNGEKTAQCSFEDIPKISRGFMFQTQIPVKFNSGGRFALGDSPSEAFPVEKGKQIIRDGYARSFTLIDPAGRGFKVSMPGEYQQVQDNRVFGWPVFMHIYTFNFKTDAGNKTFTFHFAGLDNRAVESKEGKTAGSEPLKLLVDRYGQSTRKDFAWKVKSDDDLKADVEKQKTMLAPLGGPALDTYGGLGGSGAKYGLKKTDFFHVGQAGGRQVLVTPEGNAFFHLGVCGINITDDYTTVAGREKIYEWIPPKDEQFGSAWRSNSNGVVSFYIANWIRKFGRPFTMEEWSGQVVQRLRSWGFNSSGAFSASTGTMKKMNFPYVLSLPFGNGSGVAVLPDKVGAAELMDPFAPGVEEALDKIFAKRVAPLANDPLLIGWFQGNEQHFELLPKMIPAYKASKVAAKMNLVELLRKKYGGDISKFNAAWKPASPFANFEDLKEAPLFIRSEAGAADMTEFYRNYLDAYYAIVSRVYHKYDPNHLLIGNRFTPGTANNEDVVRIAGKYLDVISVNYYTYPIEKDFLKKIHEWSGGRPIILSEWYYSSTDAGLGGGKEVANQEERGKAYRNYVEQSASLPFVVGSEWFIFNDQSLTGRFFEGFNGEGNNTGLVNVADRPYEELVAGTRLTGERIYDVIFGKVPPFVFEDARFTGKGSGEIHKIVSIPKALPGLKFDGSTTNWPGRPAEPIETGRTVIGVPNPKLRGDFRLCWDDKNLYFLIQVKDSTPCQNKKEPKSLWSGDAVELFIGSRELNKQGSMIFGDLQILLGAGGVPKVFISDQPDAADSCKLIVVPDVTGDGYVLEASIPWQAIGIVPSSGTEMLFDVGLDNSDDGVARKQQLMWNGTSKNPGDRGAWGRSRLVEN